MSAYTYGNTANAAERIKEISGVNPLKCMKCGKCSATCPAFRWISNHISLYLMYRMGISRHLPSQNPCGNVFPALHVWSVAQEM